MSAVALAAEHVRIVRGFAPDGSSLYAVDDVSLELRPGEMLGIAGESGSGKTTLVHAFLGDVRRGLRAESGDIRIEGLHLTLAQPAGFGAVCGRVVALMPQSADSVLDPIMTVEAQLVEAYRAIFGGAVEKALMMRELLAQLREFGFREPEALMRRYPHQLSGGQRQRIALCMVLVGKPAIVVLDEATTDLDVVTQQAVVRSIKTVQRERGFSTIAVSHDLRVLQDMCDRLVVMFGGKVVESGPTARVMTAPEHPYTARLIERFHLRIAALPPRTGPKAEPLLAVRDLWASHRSGLFGRNRSTVLRGIDLDLDDGEVLGIVGESGSGKTTLARVLVGLHTADRGRATFEGEPLDRHAAARSIALRRHLQIIFQNPGSALNPMLRVRDILGRRIRLFEGLGGASVAARVAELLEWVGVRADAIDCRPRMLSGGEQQRVAIARALIGSPRLLICDEILSSLDVLVQARVLELLRRIQAERHLALIFISHDISLVAALAQRIAVFAEGAICEFGLTSDVISRPQSPYTKHLVEVAYLSEDVQV